MHLGLGKVRGIHLGRWEGGGIHMGGVCIWGLGRVGVSTSVSGGVGDIHWGFGKGGGINGGLSSCHKAARRLAT